jgi:uncharacterized protein (TIGR03435 family)
VKRSDLQARNFAVSVAGVLVVSLMATPIVQTQTPVFEVASVRPAAPFTAPFSPGENAVGVTITDTRVDIRYVSLAELLARAFRVRPDQIVGPDWLGEQDYDVQATIPVGATRQQVPEMLQALLKSRFGMTTHRDSREMPVYALVVGKDGLRFRESSPDAETAPSRTPRMTAGQNGRIRWEMSNMTISALSELLTNLAGRPVVDMTGLTRKYDFALELSDGDLLEMRRLAGAALLGGDTPAGPAAASEPSGSSVSAAVQRLGLRLEARRMPVPVVVIDTINRSPTAN